MSIPMSTDDPIFAAIERDLIARKSAASTDDATRELAGTVPTTIPGIRAMLEHVLEFSDMLLEYGVAAPVLESIRRSPALYKAEVAVKALEELEIDLPEGDIG